MDLVNIYVMLSGIRINMYAWIRTGVKQMNSLCETANLSLMWYYCQPIWYWFMVISFKLARQMRVFQVMQLANYCQKYHYCSLLGARIRHDMETSDRFWSFFMGIIPPQKGPVMQSFDVFFDAGPNRQFEGQLKLPVIWEVMALMWRHCNDLNM